MHGPCFSDTNCTARMQEHFVSCSDIRIKGGRGGTDGTSTGKIDIWCTCTSKH